MQCPSNNAVVVSSDCAPGAPHYDPEGAVCAYDNTPQEAYCSYGVGPNACARCETVIQVNTDAPNRNCKAIYLKGTYDDDLALFPLDICLLYHLDTIYGSTTLTCNATGHKVLRKWHTSQVCAGNFDEEIFYDVGDSVECTGQNCPYAVLRRYNNSDLCTKDYQDFIELPVILEDCVQNGASQWVQYECNSTVIKAVQYSNNTCDGNQGTVREGAIFINGTCENSEYYDEIPYCGTEVNTDTPCCNCTQYMVDTLGCVSDTVCERAICSVADWCCTYEWNLHCVDGATQVCNGLIQVCAGHDDCPAFSFCFSINNITHDIGLCMSCDECDSCSNGIDGTCGNCGNQCLNSHGQWTSSCDWIQTNVNWEGEIFISNTLTIEECIQQAYNDGCDIANLGFNNGANPLSQNSNTMPECWCQYGHNTSTDNGGYYSCFLATSNTTLSPNTKEKMSNQTWFFILIASIIFLLTILCLIASFVLYRRKSKLIWSVSNISKSLIICNPLVILLGIGDYDEEPQHPDFEGYVQDLQVDIDIKNLERLFKYKLKYEIIPSHNNENIPKIYWTQNEIITLLQKQAKIFSQHVIRRNTDDNLNQNINNYDGLIIVISGHGMNNKLITSDYKLIDKTVIHRMFSSYYPASREVPRIIIYDMCDGDEDRKNISLKKRKKINQNNKPYTIKDISIHHHENENENKDIGKNYATDMIDVPSDSTYNLWEGSSKNPDDQLVTVHSCNTGFQSKMCIDTGSYLISKFVEKTLVGLKKKNIAKQPFLFEILDDVQQELGETKQLPTYTFNNNTRYIKFKINNNTYTETGIQIKNNNNNIDENQVKKSRTKRKSSNCNLNPIELDNLEDYLDNMSEAKDDQNVTNCSHNMNIELINTHSDLWKWLNNIHMIEYYNLFVEQGFEETPEMISYITNDVLVTIGISNLQHRKIIMEYIYDIKNDNGNGVKDSTKQMKIGLTTRIREKFNSKQTDLDGLTNYLDYVYESKNDDELSINKKDVNKLDHTVNDNDDINIVYDTAK